MPEITVEHGGVRSEACSECGRTAAVAHGCIYANDDAYAVYFLDWCERHDGDRHAFLTIARGEWSAGSMGGERTVVCLELGVHAMTLTDHPFRERPAFFGRFLPRAAALRSPDASTLWQLAERIVVDDPQIAAVLSWIRSGAGSALRCGAVDR